MRPIYFMAAVVLGIAASAIAQNQSQTVVAPQAESYVINSPPELSLKLPIADMPAAAGLESETVPQADRISRAWHDLSLPQGGPDISTFHPGAGSPLDFFGDIFETVNFGWTIGQSQSLHLHLPSHEVGEVTPFVSLPQDMDDYNEHIRNGLGAGLSSNIDRFTSVGIEGQYIEGANEVNPSLDHESRMMLWISGQF